MNRNDEWIPFKNVIETIQKMGELTWMKNSKLKYIDVRIDTRDMHCYLLDRNQKPVTLKEIEEAIKNDPYIKYKEVDSNE